MLQRGRGFSRFIRVLEGKVPTRSIEEVQVGDTVRIIGRDRSTRAVGSPSTDYSIGSEWVVRDTRPSKGRVFLGYCGWFLSEDLELVG